MPGKVSLPSGWSKTGTGFIELVNALCLSVFKRLLENDLVNMLQLLLGPEVVRQLELMILEGPF